MSQAFANIDITLNDADYAAEGLQRMASIGTIIPVEKGPTEDEFFLTFERLGAAENVFVEAEPAPLPDPQPQPLDPEFGIRDFAEVNATMSKLTGISVAQNDVANTYEAVHQALPVGTEIRGFISSQQMGVTQLAISYCNALVDNTTLRTSYFPGFPFGTDESTAFNDRDLLLDPLINNMVGNGLSTQPDLVTLRTRVNEMVDVLVGCTTCNEPDRTERIVKGACAAVLGSAAVMVQ